VKLMRMNVTFKSLILLLLPNAGKSDFFEGENVHVTSECHILFEWPPFSKLEWFEYCERGLPD